MEKLKVVHLAGNEKPTKGFVFSTAWDLRWSTLLELMDAHRDDGSVSSNQGAHVDRAPFPKNQRIHDGGPRRSRIGRSRLYARIEELATDLEHEVGLHPRARGGPLSFDQNPTIVLRQPRRRARAVIGTLASSDQKLETMTTLEARRAHRGQCFIFLEPGTRLVAVIDRW
ncbi:hypothetical protein KM043_009671 [Ampulex compressa]|nr:hypothetical protein KM043_009671 [Ampulex compressa]